MSKGTKSSEEDSYSAAAAADARPRVAGVERSCRELMTHREDFF